MIEKTIKSILGCGLDGIKRFVVIEGEKVYPDESDIEVNEQFQTAFIRDVYDGKFEDTSHLSWKDGGVIWKRTLKNISGGSLTTTELGVELTGLNFGEKPEKDYFYHVENPRIYSQLAMLVDLKRSADMVEDSGFDSTAGTKWADPGVVSERIGASPYQPFPAILVSNLDTDRGIVHGSLSQKIFFHNYMLSHEEGGMSFLILSSCKAINSLEVGRGAVLTDSWYLGSTERADDLEAMFSEYTDILRKRVPLAYGASNINRHSVIWGSWNDGIFRDIDELRLLKMAEFLKENLPTVEWMQIDDGYAKLAGELEYAHGLGAPYENSCGVDLKKFPNGLKHFTEEIKKCGIRPAVWIGGKSHKESLVFKEHPEWFFDYSYRLPNAGVFDPSIPDAREYMKSALDFFFTECGFDGMKHDFWSYAFEDSGDFLKNNDETGYQWRTWWLSEVRKRLPGDGYFQTGCDIVMGNPFLGEFFTNYRYGTDIGHGDWESVLINFMWGSTCFALHIGDIIVPNSDSIGLLPGLTDDEALLCINFCLISRSLVEVSGWLYQDPDHPRMKWVKKALACPNNGQDVFFANFDYRTTHDAPEIWYIKTPHFSLFSNDSLPCRTIGVFNLGEDEKTYCLRPENFGLDPNEKYLITDVWSLKTEVFLNEYEFALAPHVSRLLAISVDNGKQQILDCNMKIVGTGDDSANPIPEFAFDGSLEIVFSRKPENTELAQYNNFVMENGDGNWIVKCDYVNK